MNMKTKKPHKGAETQRLNFERKWAHKRADCVAALRAGHSVGRIVRAYETPEKAVRNWQIEENIAPFTGKPRPMPAVGERLA